MSEVQEDDRLAALRALSSSGGLLNPDSPHASINNVDWWSDGDPTPQRQAVHKRLLSQERQAHPGVRQEKRALLLAGPPGAGKSTTRDGILGGDSARYRSIDPDRFKELLLAEAMADGSYEQKILPASLGPASGTSLHPMELASLVHEESSFLANQLRDQAIRDGDNVVIDTVLGSAEKARSISAQLEAAGYDVQVVDVEVPFEVSEARIRQKWLEGNEAARRGEGLGGRWVPSDFARNVFDGPDGRSRPEANARMVAEESPAVSRYRVYRTTAEQAEAKAGPTLETDMSRATRGGPLVPTRSGSVAEVPQARALPGVTRAGRMTPGRAGPARVDRGR
ncbi:zeta toxin family protein [Clavibacter michiganensis]|uniref:UDP-N-acetylglucosamine kinase n=2 Tax=Clavibacter michiganensis subsp. insidiosus TaxID=33014 RepID=A0A0D5CL87_9MICO|nr:zeta toxin family protein [Clavibacter michiganensis]AJW80074.1 toxin component of a toxin/antitoxin system [Clavibacter michiganensis subsp. insidiosus]OQJ58932.1 toxin component of a toxin/antitoxin system [Clavibacter michiganensis subsp. insidiosus]RII85559.1 toxin component of a toxin/antitoxin system [Clavibacter michiganensis subsp. insidiosus]RMC81470.1 toxin component of a toxin/antitoxin system [Clavibacter michiganensis subsp. insidiosus]